MANTTILRFLSDPGLSTGPIYGSSLSNMYNTKCKLNWLMKIPTQY